MCIPRKTKYRKLGEITPPGAQARVIRTKLARIMGHENKTQKSTLVIYLKDRNQVHIATIKQCIANISICKHILETVDTDLKDPNDYVPWILAFSKITEHADVHALLHKIEMDYKLDMDIIITPEEEKITELLSVVPDEEEIIGFINEKHPPEQ